MATDYTGRTIAVGDVVTVGGTVVDISGTTVSIDTGREVTTHPAAALHLVGEHARRAYAWRSLNTFTADHGGAGTSYLQATIAGATNWMRSVVTPKVRRCAEVTNQTGTATTDWAVRYDQKDNGLFLHEGLELSAYVGISSTTSVRFRFGAAHNPSAINGGDVVDGMYLEADSSVRSNWSFCTADNSAVGGGNTRTDTLVALAADTWFHVLMRFGTSSCKCWLDGALVATNSTNIPADDGDNRDCATFFQIVGNGATFRRGWVGNHPMETIR